MKSSSKKALGVATGLATLAANLVASATGANAATVTGCGTAPTAGTLTNNGTYCQLVLDTAGSSSWTLPTGITGLTALLVGGGGGAGAVYYNVGENFGYAGDGGEVAYLDLSAATGGDTVDTVVGAAGLAQVSTPTFPTDGGTSSVSLNTTQLASALGGTANSLSGPWISTTPNYFGYYTSAKGLHGTSASTAGLNPSTDGTAPAIFSDLNYEYGVGGDVVENTPVVAKFGQGGGVTATSNTTALLGDGGVGTVIYRYDVLASTYNMTITASTSGTGTGSVSVGSGPVNSGDTFSSTATPDAGSVFDSWSCSPGSYSTNSATLSFVATEDVSCEAIFNLAAPLTHHVTVTYGGTGTGTASNLSEDVVDGEFFFSTATPDVGSTFDGWVCDPTTFNYSDVEIGFVPTGDVTCVAMFNTASVVTYNVTVSTAGTGSGSISNLSTTVNSGDTFSSIATPGAGSFFDYWDCSPSAYSTDAAELTFTATEDVTCVAYFTLLSPVTYTVNWDANGGSVSPATMTVNDGDLITIPTPTRSGYRFTGWADGEGVVPGVGSYNAAGNHTWIAQWELIPVVPVVAPAAIKATFYFGGDSSKLLRDARAKLVALSKKLRAYPGAKIVVEGYVFRTPDVSNDAKLSLARAKSIVRYLRSLGVKATFEANAKGIAKQRNAHARRAVLVATWQLPN